MNPRDYYVPAPADADRNTNADEEGENVARQRRYDKLDRDEDRYDRERHEDI